MSHAVIIFLVFPLYKQLAGTLSVSFYFGTTTYIKNH